MESKRGSFRQLAQDLDGKGMPSKNFLGWRKTVLLGGILASSLLTLGAGTVLYLHHIRISQVNKLASSPSVEEKRLSFNWTLSNLEELASQKKRITSQDMVKIYGEPFKQDKVDNVLALTYFDTSDVRKKPGKVEFNFLGGDGHEVLDSFSVERLRIQEKPAANQGEYHFNWTRDAFLNLKVKDDKAGDAGISYDEIVRDYGKPSDVYIMGKYDIEKGFRFTLHADYAIEGTDGKVLELHFYRQEKDTYLLEEKYWWSH